MTQLELAKKGKVSALMRKIAKIEGLSPEKIRKGVALGTIVIPANKTRYNLKKPCGIGAGLQTKVNANVGTSLDCAKIADEIKKTKISITAGADTVMDLSTGGNLAKIRTRLLESSTVPFGTVPIYEAVVGIVKKQRPISSMSEDDILKVLEQQAKDGVDFFTIHCGVTLESLKRLKRQSRIVDIVSRGGAFLAEWMLRNKKENPLYENFKEVLKIARKYDVTLSLGDGMRPGCVLDATDRSQIQELILLGELANKASQWGVQTIIEGPGHVPLDQIAANITLQKKLCQGRPFYVLGPLVTDIAPGYDHITASIGAAIAAASGADFLCYVTASEHLRLPTIDDVREGVIASRIAAHAADIAKGVKKAIDWDKNISLARKKRNWKKQLKLAIDPQRAKRLRNTSRPHPLDTCTMCSKLCSIKLMEEYF